MEVILVLLAIMVPGAIAIAFLALWRAWRRLDKRRTPLTFELRNLPGENLRRRASEHSDAFMEAAALVIALGPIVFSAWLLSRIRTANVELLAMGFGWGDVLMAVLASGFLAWLVWKLMRHGRSRRWALEGLQAELAVAQCLTPLIAEGAMVFHDFPTDRGNIDHIVIGRSAVFAIETKWRRKPPQRGRDAARVQFDGQQLLFPHHAETRPIEQARYQAEWLAKFLASGTGEPVPTRPLLALPGWYVEKANRAVRHDLLVSNCHNPAFMMGDKFGPALPEAMRRRIAHVISQKYPALKFE
ncbi:hypothetical protein GCM10028862_01810 [Luteimonas pelagia]